jgi:hypothetical protein
MYSMIGLGQQFDSSGNPLGGEFLINTDTSQGNLAHATSVAAGSNGDFVVVWTDLSYGGALGLDGDGLGVFAQRFGDAGPIACSPAPLSGCREQVVEKRGTFRFREGSSPNSNSLTWRWLMGEATSKAEFGDPFTDTSYAFCVYDSSTLISQPLIATVVPPGGHLRARGHPLLDRDEWCRTTAQVFRWRSRPGRHRADPPQAREERR